MSSIFTFDPDPPKALSSPWPVLPAKRQKSGSQGKDEAVSISETPLVQRLTDFAISSLEPEPQEGSTEYKLHLLLRPRRSFAALSTVQRVSGSHLSKSRLSRSESGSPSPSPLLKVSAAAASSNQSRQSRLQNLTTQLLWRLQQSSPHHPASRSDLVVPALPNVSERIDVPRMPGPLLPGLEDSQGALYEIGVADDGTIVGLTNDELDESLTVLRAMAFSLGCNVQLNRRIIVGDCQWLEDGGGSGKTAQKLRAEQLWVAEALISPDSPLDGPGDLATQEVQKVNDRILMTSALTGSKTQTDKPRRDQLRVSLTGSTTSGKSSLLGALSTSTLDNGRGKSRLSLLKHRHEIASGVTSSVTGSLMGYQDDDPSEVINASRVHVVNYASGNVSSWTDIHYAANPGRLVFLNDSAGHPRFRRTTVRGLVSWAPHWTICCIAADSEEDTAGKAGATASASDILGSPCTEVDLATAHLDLCLNLGLPLIVVITKLDLASLSALKPTLRKVLSALKSAGRRPEILSRPSDEQSFLTQSINRNDELEVIKMISAAPEADICSILHLSLDGLGGSQNELTTPSTLFHIDEIFAANSASLSAQQGIVETSIDSILSGHLRRGALFVGQEVIIGPFSNSFPETDSIAHEVHRANSYPRIKGSPKVNNTRRILPRPLSGDFSLASQSNQIPAQSQYVWRKVRVCSIRNLRLPVHELSSDQVGTVGLCPPGSIADTGSVPLASEDRIRKGMVLMSIPDQSAIGLLQAYKGFVALFEATEYSAFHPGSSVISYMASIRVPAKILQSRNVQNHAAFAEGVFDFEDGIDGNGQTSVPTIAAAGKTQQTMMTFQFLTSQEWFEMGIQVLVMPASGFGASNLVGEKGDKASAGLDGLVGTIVQGLAW